MLENAKTHSECGLTESRTRRNGMADIFSGLSGDKHQLGNDLQEGCLNEALDVKGEGRLHGLDEKSVAMATTELESREVSATMSIDDGVCEKESVMDIVHCPRYRTRRNALSHLQFSGSNASPAS